MAQPLHRSSAAALFLFLFVFFLFSRQSDLTAAQQKVNLILLEHGSIDGRSRCPSQLGLFCLSARDFRFWMERPTGFLARYLRAFRDRRHPSAVYWIFPDLDAQFQKRVLSDLMFGLKKRGMDVGFGPVAPIKVHIEPPFILWARRLAACLLALAIPLILKGFSAGELPLPPDPRTSPDGSPRVFAGPLSTTGFKGNSPALNPYLIFGFLEVRPWRGFLTALLGGALAWGLLQTDAFRHQIQGLHFIGPVFILPFVLFFGFEYFRGKPFAIAWPFVLVLAVLFWGRLKMFFPVSLAEHACRDWMEAALGIRPRTGEMLGWFFFILAPLAPPWQALGLLGPVVTLNSFLHAQAPLERILARSLFSFAIAYIVGMTIYRRTSTEA